jgi:hypothetical protein
MLYVFRTELSELTQLSVTDINCTWAKKDLKKVFEPTPHKDYCCVPRWDRLKLFASQEAHDAFRKEVFNDFLKLAPDSAFGLHRYGCN